MEDNKQQLTTGANSVSVVDALPKSVESFIETYKANKSRVDKALLVTKKVLAVDTDEQDEYANKLLVKIKAAKTQIVENRIQSTKAFDNAKTFASSPEKELIAEITRIEGLRNVRAQKKAEEEAKRLKELEDKKRYAAYEGKIKSAIVESVNTGIVDKIFDIEKDLSERINGLTLEKADALETALKGVKPSLKSDFYDNLFIVPFDPKQMTAEQYSDVVERAKNYDPMKYETLNKSYRDSAQEILNKWIAKIPEKKRSLEAIAKGGDNAEFLKRKSEETARADAEALAKQEQEKKSEISREAVESAQEAALNAEFEQQSKTQEIEESNKMPKGTRKVKKLVLSEDVINDVSKLSSIISKLVLHVGLNQSGDNDFFKIKKGEKVLCDGIQYWLNKAASIENLPAIDGLTETTEVKTVARK